MNCHRDKFRSDMSKVRGLGPAHNGTSLWWMQRVSALALIPLTIWFAVIVNHVMIDSYAKLKALIESPFNTIMAILVIVVGIYHATIGMKEIVEDYVHCEAGKAFLNIFLQLFGIATILAGVCAVLVFHFSVFNLS